MLSWAILLLLFQVGSAEQHAKRGYQLAQQGELKAAEAELRRAVELAPADAVSLAYLGTVLFRQEKLAEASGFFEKALRLDPADAGTRYNLALTQFRLGQNEPARANLERILKSKPGHPQALLLMGNVLESLGEDKRAVELLESVPELVRRAPDAILSLARCYYRANEKEKARKVFELLLGHSAGPEAAFSGGRAAAQAGDPDTAEKLLESIRSTYPDKVKLGYELALIQYNAGRFAGSRSTLLWTLAGGSQDARLFRLLAWTYQRENRPVEAARIMLQAVNLDPAAEAGYTELGMILLEQKRYSDAYDVAMKAIEKMANSAAAYRVKGLAQSDLNSFRQALASFLRAVALNPNDAEALLLMAQTQANLWMVPEASATYEKGMLKFPRDARFPESYGRMLVDRAAKPDAGAELRAQALFEKALALDDSLADAHHELGKLLLRKGKARNAVAHLEAAVKRNSTNSKFWLTLANAYRELERDEDHRKALQTYRTLEAQEGGPKP